MKRMITAIAAAIAMASAAAPATAAVNLRQRAKLRYQSSGGRYSQREKDAVHALQDAADRHINRLKRNRVRAR